jgi:exodeoxyribonuclease-3
VRVATFNAASVRARLPLVLEWIADNEPDVLAIQETKVENDKFPGSDFEDLGYHLQLNGQKSWNGVATLTREPAQNLVLGFVDDLFPEDARILACDYGGLTVINTYVPNGNKVGSEKWEYKLRWLDRFHTLLQERYRPDQPLIWLGDINIAPTADDVFDSKRMLGQVGHHPDEFSRLAKIVDWGLVDVFRKFHSGHGDFTYWDFVIPRSVERNLGWRIDHIYATAPLAAVCTECRIDVEARKQERPSDHTFVVAEFDW